MPRVSPIQEDFSTGEVSPLFYGRVSNDRYKTSLQKSFNEVSLLQGPVLNRPGTKYVAATKYPTKKARNMRFEYSTDQAYMLEFGDQYIRFFRNDGQIMSGLSPYEITSPYLEADLFQIKFTQSADVLYLTHPNYAPRKLSRFSNTSWLLETINFIDGPYINSNFSTRQVPGFTTAYATNLSQYGLVVAAATGTGVAITSEPLAISAIALSSGGFVATITTSTPHRLYTNQFVTLTGVTGTTNINGRTLAVPLTATTFQIAPSPAAAGAYGGGGQMFPDMFVSTDAGRLIRVLTGTAWGYGRIASYVSPYQATIDIIKTFTDTTTKMQWRFGAWSSTLGYPSAVCFHEDRLCFATGQTIDASNSGDYENFAPTDDSNVITPSSALRFTLNDNKVNKIRWMTSDEKGLIVGTAGGPWLVRASTANEALSQTNVKASPATYEGSADVQAVQVGKVSLFLTPSGKQLREISYYFSIDGFRSPDMSFLGEHITGEGITQLTYQKEPQPIVWGVRQDGVLVGMTYQREEDALRAGWHRHELGGVSDASGTHAKVESADCIPSTDGKRTQVWLIVQRWINGQVFRSQEFITKFFDKSMEQKDAFFMDCGLTYDNPISITNITAATPPVVTAAAHGFSNGDRVYLSGLIGSRDVNERKFYVANAATNTFELQSAVGVNEIGVDDQAYVSGGQARKLVSTVSGLGHLEGETVSILADGAVLPSQVVTSGSVSLTVPSAIVQIGLGYNSDGQMHRLEAGAADGTALGKTRRTQRVGFLLYRTSGLKIGTDFTDMNTLTYRSGADPMGVAPPLYSGIVTHELEADYDFENCIAWRQSQPLPYMILAVMPQMVTQDRS